MKTRSFTLIELLIVLVIIGVVVILVIPQYQQLIIKARGAEAKRNLTALGDSVWKYYLEAGEFPSGEPWEFPIPSVLDVKVVNPSKYFRYSYGYAKEEERCTVQLDAYDSDTHMNGPIGSTYIYILTYVNYEVQQPITSFTFIPIGQGWYKNYKRTVKTVQGVGAGEDGW